MPPKDNAKTSTSQGRLQARPQHASQKSTSIGLLPLQLDGSRDGFLYVPSNSAQPAPLILVLHGAGSSAYASLAPFLPMLDRAGLLLLAPDSRQQTWDVIMGNYGKDVSFIDQALTHVFNHYEIDTSRLAIGGFSDGASYALSLGLINGDLFTHIIAFSPGFIAPGIRQGKPRIYISHGTHDAVLPIEVCSRRIVPRLQREQYDVTYREFDGPHTIPLDIVREAWTWFNP